MVMEIVISVILLFVGIAVLVVIHVCIVGRAFGRGNQGMVNMVVQRSSIGSKRMSNEDLKMLPCFDYVDGRDKGSSSSPVDCAVCLENFKDGEKCRLLPNCRHSFHALCIDSWLLKTPICPICRTCANPPKVDVILGEGSSVSGQYGIELT
ncbi:RING-H2 finger protein ATL74 [Ziziphus jujuba]|uniref:RING-type E3 ubiquitin transferase n=1 Tax=Ziziphus jujuba TaxID=326968 RepID=A0A6P3YXL3_ZIZJJ|nr:RING-H2 finger protein ATL74 [Ziziphus jujuba]